MSKKLFGKNVELVPITREDTPDVIRWRNYDHIREKFIYRGEFTEESHEKWLKEYVDTGKTVQFVIYVEDVKIGSVYLRDIDKEKKLAEYGIFIGERAYWGKGYGSECAKLMVEFGTSVLGLDTIFLRVFEKNTRAIRSYEKVGFIVDGTSKEIEINGERANIVFMKFSKGN